jgi:hypothetical protein
MFKIIVQVFTGVFIIAFLLLTGILKDIFDEYKSKKKEGIDFDKYQFQSYDSHYINPFFLKPEKNNDELNVLVNEYNKWLYRGIIFIIVSLIFFIISTLILN